MMRPADVVGFAAGALRGFRLRTALMLVAMAIGVAAVVVLTSLGEAARLYVTGQFAELGTNLLIVLPGRSETTGGPPPLTGETPRDLTVGDSQALTRSRRIRHIAPLTVGSAPVAWGKLQREVTVLGSTASMYHIRHLKLSQGRFLPSGHPGEAPPVCVLGSTVVRELFGNQPPLGEWVRIGGWRFRVIGVLAPQGVSLGLDINDLAIIPVTAAQGLFNTSSLFRIMIEVRERGELDAARKEVLNILRLRHEGEEDVTVISQDAVLTTFDRIFTTLTLAVAGIAGISLVVAGILIMNVMLIAVSQRTAEIGLLKAVGAPARQIAVIFLVETVILSVAGAALGLVVGLAGNWLLQQAYPDLIVQAPPWALAAACGVAITTGLIFGIMPARRAAALDPITALASGGR